MRQPRGSEYFSQSIWSSCCWHLHTKRWAKNPQLNAFVRGVTAAATGAIAGAVIVLARRSIYDLPTFAIAIVSLAVLFRWKVPEPIVIGCAGMAGLLLRPA